MTNLQVPISSSYKTRFAPKAALLGLLLLVQLATSLYQLPLNRLVEQRLCRSYYRDRDDTSGHLMSPNKGGDIDESLCKIDDVQQQLAWILGVMETAWIIGDFVMAIPLGFIAEKYGQKVVLWLNLVPRIFMLAWAPIIGLGFSEALPTSAIIAAPFLSFLGGDCVFGSITYSLAAGSTDDYVARATLFGYMSSVSYITNLLGPGLASATMGTVLWLPFLIGICLLLLAVPTISLLPASSTYRKDRSHGHGTEEEQRLLSSPLLKATRPANSHNINSPSQPSQPFKTFIDLTKSHIKNIYTTIIRSDPNDPNNNDNPHRRNLPLLMASFLLTSLASSDTKLLPQYISKRYAWHFSSVGYLLSCKAVINFILLAFIIPRVLKRDRSTSSPINYTSNAEQRPSSSQGHLPTNPSSAEPSSTTLNITYARTCLKVSLLGATLIALSSTTTLLFPSLAVYALGSALPVFTFSLLKSPYFVIPSPPTAWSSLTQSSPAASAAAWTANLSSSAEESFTSANSLHGDAERHNETAAHDNGHTSSNTETQLFAIVMMVKTLGSLLAAPLMAALWMRGISLGGAALGIPYIVSAMCYAGAVFLFAKLTV